MNTLDPLNIRKSTLGVFKESTLLKVNLEKVDEIAKIVKHKVDQKQVLDEEQFGSLNPSPQLIFILDTINFCFWAKKDQEKWTVEFPKRNFISNGWYGLVAAVQRAQKEGIPILDAGYLKKISFSDVKHIFRSSNDTEMPLLFKRYQFLRETGRVLSEKYDGNIYNLLVNLDLDAAKIVTEVAKNFPSFQDCMELDKKEACFYKRAQIFAYDISLLPNLKIRNLKVLTSFADYKIPQILRALGVIEYKPELAKKIDNFILLEKGSREEIEIRSATIQVCELIAKKAGILPVLCDNVLWKMSQSLKDVKPYHRVLTTCY